ncbi:hypothetical protein C8Q79DRAFT_1004229 [Trametes meyenii]|nr:hypothetical protein C8Q79DRAFT_1004229 [Trametes meyenii]
MEQTVPRTVLNNDVLLNILAVSDTLTICRLMATSRQLYHEGPKHLLKKTVVLRSENKLVSFLTFMAAEAPYRFQFLHSLQIDIGHISEAATITVEYFFISAAPFLNIRRLTLDRAEEFFESGTGIPGAFALCLRTVEHMKVSEIGRRASIFLEHSRSRLVSADLTMIPRPIPDDSDDDSDEEREDDDTDDSRFRNPILQLRNSQETLKTLNVRWCDTDCEIGVLYEQTYPHVKDLTLSANELPYTTHYARAFPNIETLTIGIAPREIDELGTAMDDFVEHRYMNKIDQLQNGKWEGLKSVHGTLIDLFLLGALCPVERVHINGPHMDKRMFRSVLTTARPAYVNFQAFDVDLFYEQDFTHLVRGRWLEPVRAFEITVFFAGILTPEEVDVPKALEILVQGIKQMPSLVSLGVTLCCYGLHPGMEGSVVRFGTRLPLCPAEEYLRDLDLDAFARRIRDAAPRLRSVGIALIGHRARPGAFATLGDGPEAYEKDAVEALPLRHPTGILSLLPAVLSDLSILGL